MTTGPWVADPTVAWIIALHVRLSARIPRAGALGPRLHRARELRRCRRIRALRPALLAQVTAPGPSPLRAAVSGSDLAIGAEHRHCDGLGLLALLGATVASTPTSSARGVGDRPTTGAARAPVGRVLEACPRPPAVAAPGRAVARPAATQPETRSSGSACPGGWAPRSWCGRRPRRPRPQPRARRPRHPRRRGHRRVPGRGCGPGSPTTAPCSGCATSSGCPRARCAPPSATRSPSPATRRPRRVACSWPGDHGGDGALRPGWARPCWSRTWARWAHRASRPRLLPRHRGRQRRLGRCGRARRARPWSPSGAPSPALGCHA